MIIDKLQNAPLYYTVHPRLVQAFQYLHNTDLKSLPAGKYTIDGDNLFAIVQEYQTMDAANEQMECHRKYIDVQYMITGAEQVGHSVLDGQQAAKEYDAENDYMTVADRPDFFTKMREGTFMIFFPTDLHMPCINNGAVATVKKVVIKVRVN